MPAARRAIRPDDPVRARLANLCPECRGEHTCTPADGCSCGCTVVDRLWPEQP